MKTMSRAAKELALVYLMLSARQMSHKKSESCLFSAALESFFCNENCLVHTLSCLVSILFPHPSNDKIYQTVNTVDVSQLELETFTSLASVINRYFMKEDKGNMQARATSLVDPMMVIL